jgi:hypothetical protein
MVAQDGRHSEFSIIREVFDNHRSSRLHRSARRGGVVQGEGRIAHNAGLPANACHTQEITFIRSVAHHLDVFDVGNAGYLSGNVVQQPLDRQNFRRNSAEGRERTLVFVQPLGFRGRTVAHLCHAVGNNSTSTAKFHRFSFL